MPRAELLTIDRWLGLSFVLVSFTITGPAPGVASSAAALVSGPRVRDAAPPPMPPTAWGGGEVMLELTVDAAGQVAAVRTLRATPPYTGAMVETVTSWSFDPAIVLARGIRTAVTGRVLVVGLFRPPTFYAGPAPGAPAEILEEPSDDLPRLLFTAPVSYPPNAAGNRVVVLELAVSGGVIREQRVLTPAGGFDGAAIQAVQQWRFAPPRAAAAPDPIHVYAVLGFRAPIR